MGICPLSGLSHIPGHTLCACGEQSWVTVPRPDSPTSLDQSPDHVPLQDADEALDILSAAQGRSGPDSSVLQGLTPSNAHDRIGTAPSLNPLLSGGSHF